MKHYAVTRGSARTRPAIELRLWSTIFLCSPECQIND